MSIKTTKAFTKGAIPVNSESRDQLIERYLSLGFRKIGSGSRAYALEHPNLPNSVVKVGIYDHKRPEQQEDGSWTNPIDGWLLYVEKFAKSRSKHVPKVHGVTLYGHCYVAHLERLYPLDRKEFSKRVAHDATESPTPSIARMKRRLDDLIGEWDGTAFHDIWGDNVMKRSDGTIVITDPIAMMSAGVRGA